MNRPAFFAENQEGFSLIGFINSFVGKPEEAALILICFALFLGIIKGRFALKRTVNRVVTRIRTLPSPFPIKSLYTRGYLILLGSMVLFGMVFKFLPLPLDVKGFIDFTIGAALINGGMLYFREAFASSK